MRPYAWRVAGLAVLKRTDGAVVGALLSMGLPDRVVFLWGFQHLGRCWDDAGLRDWHETVVRAVLDGLFVVQCVRGGIDYFASVRSDD
jgi:hypothetical protein